VECELKNISIDDYAKFELSNNEAVFKHNNIWWRKIRIGFYRPILPFYSYDKSSISIPWMFYIGGFQFSVTNIDDSDSYVNYFIFDDLKNYDIKNLKYNIRRQIHIGEKNLKVNMVKDIDDFVRQGYHIYKSFQAKTNYMWKKERLDVNNFRQWAEKIYSHNILVLGAYLEEILIAINIIAHVQDFIFLMSSFADSTYSKYYPYDLLLHEIRKIAQKRDNVKFIFYGNYASKDGVNQSKILRGAKLISLPSYYYINPFIKYFIKNSVHKVEGNISNA
jgi:hypothetical protein